VANRRITEFPAIVAGEIVDQDLMTLVHVFEADPSLRNKKLTFTEFRLYLNQYYANISGATISGNFVITGNLSVSGASTFNTLTTTGASTFSGIVVQNNATVSGTISGATITGNALQGTTLNTVTVTATTVTGTSGLFTSGVYQTLSGATITGNAVSATSGVFTSLSGTTITGGTINATTGTFQSLSTPVLSISGNLSVASGLTVTGIAQFASGVQITGTLSGGTVTGTTARFTTYTGVSGVYTTQLSGATITGNTGRFSNITGVSGVFTTRVSGATVTGNTGSFGNVTGISGVFTEILSGLTITGNTGKYGTISGVSGVYTTQLSGATITGNNINATFVTGASGVFTSNISGLTVTGTSGLFTSINGVSGIFSSSLSGNTVTGNNANFTTVTGITGTFTTIVSGLTVTGNTGSFTNLTGIAGVFTTSISGSTVTGNTVQGTSGVFSNLSGTTITGTTVNATTGVFNTLQATNLSFTNTTVSGDLNVLGSGFFASGVRITGTLSGTTITGNIVNAISGVFTTIVSGATAQFTTGTFTSLTGTTTTGTTANFATGNFTSLTGTTSRGTTANFTTGTFTSLTGATTTGTTANFATGNFTSLTGTTTTGSTANFTNGNFISLTGTTATFTTGNFNSITGGIATITSGVFATGNTTNPSISFSGDSDTGIYSRGANSIAITNNGVTRFTITDSGIVRIGPGSTQPLATVPVGADVHFEGIAPTPNTSTYHGVAIVSRGGDVFGGSAAEALHFYSVGWNSYASITHGVSGFGDSLTLSGCDDIFIDPAARTVLRGPTSVEIQTGVGVTPRVIANATELVINGNTLDYDFRVGGDTNPNLFFVDASTDRIGIGTASPATLLHLSSSTGSATPTPTELRLATTTAASDWSTTNPWGRISFYSEDGSAFGPKIHASIDATALTTAGGTSDIVFRTNNNTSNTLEARMVIKGDSSAAGARVGIGTTSPGGALEIQAAATIHPLIVQGPSSEFARIDSSGRLLVGTNSAYATPLSTTVLPIVQIHTNSSANNAAISQLMLTSWSPGAEVGPSFSLNRADSGTIGTFSPAIGSSDVIGNIRFNGSDGVKFIEAAKISAVADGIWGVGDGPARLVFSTTADGADSPTPRAIIDSSGRLLVGGTNARVFDSSTATLTPITQIESTGSESAISITRNTAGNTGPGLFFGKSRSGANNGTTVVQNEDRLGTIFFEGTDGANLIEAATIAAEVDGIPGLTDMPGRLVFSTTPDGTSSPTERMRITSSGNVGIGTSIGTWTPGATLDVRSGSNNTTVEEIAAFARPDAAVRASINKGVVSGNGISFGTTTNHPLVLRTNALERIVIGATGTTTLTSDASTAPFVATIGASEAIRVDGSGRFLVGTTTALSNISIAGTLGSPRFQVEGNTGAAAGAAFTRTTAGSAFVTLNAGSSGNNVANNNGIGHIQFNGFDGTNYINGASISAAVDGTPGNQDMPCRLVFSTTADGTSSPTERLRITNDGVHAYNQPAPAAVPATATLTVANLKTGIITSTSAAATDMTLPTGTLTEGGFAANSLYDNFTFEWSVINTGPSLVRILDNGTSHTVTGSRSVATGTSGRFASRRTAANTFVTYRLS
jgi:hypothetical protein